MMAMFNQLSGLNAVNFYSSQIFDEVFTSSNAAALTTVATGATQVAGVIAAPFVANCVNMKNIFLLGHASAFITMGLVVFFSEVYY